VVGYGTGAFFVSAYIQLTVCGQSHAVTARKPTHAGRQGTHLVYNKSLWLSCKRKPCCSASTTKSKLAAEVTPGRWMLPRSSVPPCLTSRTLHSHVCAGVPDINSTATELHVSGILTGAIPLLLTVLLFPSASLFLTALRLDVATDRDRLQLYNP
jgi:hypothetical protein